MLLHDDSESIARLLVHTHPVFVRMQDVPPDGSILGFEVHQPIEVRDTANAKRYWKA